jgi:hypothetical protein
MAVASHNDEPYQPQPGEFVSTSAPRASLRDHLVGAAFSLVFVGTVAAIFWFV